MKAVFAVVGLALPTFRLFYMCACASAPAPDPAPAVAPDPVAVPVDAPERHLFSREAPSVPQVEAEMEEPQHRVMSRAYFPKAKKVQKDKNVD